MTHAHAPLVSVVLPVFNGGAYLEPALRSLMAQNYQRLEIIAIDDGSIDDSLATLERLASQDPRIRLVSRANRGLVETLNEGLALARGQLIARMDADDISYPTRILRQVDAFARQPQLALCGTDFHVIRGKRTYASGLKRWPDADLGVLSRFFTAFRHSTVMFNPRVIAPGQLRYDPAYPHAEDFELFRRICSAHPARILQEPLLGYRVHRWSVSTTAAKAMRRTHLRIVCENLRALGLDAATPELMKASPSPEAAFADMVRLAGMGQALPASRDPSERAANEEGCAHLFFFLRAMALDEFGYGFAARFLDRTGGWSYMRRRETYMLRALRDTPALASLAWRSLVLIDQVRTRVPGAPGTPGMGAA